MKKILLCSSVILITFLFSVTIFSQEKDVKSKNLIYAVFPSEFSNLVSVQNEKLPAILRDAFVNKLKLDGDKLIKDEIIDSVLGNKNAAGLSQEEIVKISKSLNADVAIHFTFMVRSNRHNIYSDFFDIFIYAIDVYTGKLIWFDTKSGFFNLLNSDDIAMNIAWDFIHRLEFLGY